MTNPASSIHILALNLAYISFFFIWTLVSLVLFFPALLLLRIYSGCRKVTCVRWLIWAYGRVWRQFVGLIVPFTSEFAPGAKRVEPCILVANHQSFIDVYCFGALPFKDLCIVVRNWPFHIPFYGYIMRMAGYIDIDSLNHDTFIAKAKDELQRGATLLIFPEGTRSRNGDLNRFRSGAFAAAAAAGIPVVPVVINGTGQVLPPGKSTLRPGRICITILPPHYPATTHNPLSEHRTLKKTVMQAMSTQLKTTDDLAIRKNHCNEEYSQ